MYIFGYFSMLCEMRYMPYSHIMCWNQWDSSPIWILWHQKNYTLIPDPSDYIALLAHCQGYSSLRLNLKTRQCNVKKIMQGWAGDMEGSVITTSMYHDLLTYISHIKEKARLVTLIYMVLSNIWLKTWESARSNWSHVYVRFEATKSHTMTRGDTLYDYTTPWKYRKVELRRHGPALFICCHHRGWRVSPWTFYSGSCRTPLARQSLRLP